MTPYTLHGPLLLRDIPIPEMSGFLKSKSLANLSMDLMMPTVVVYALGYKAADIQHESPLGIARAEVQRLFLQFKIVCLGRGHQAILEDPLGRPFYLTVNRDLTLSTSERQFQTPIDPAAAYPEGSLARKSMEWILSDDAGTSSNTIASIGAGLPPRQYSFPHDISDIGRCMRLLAKVPELHSALTSVARAVPGWQPFVEEWGTLARLYAACTRPDGSIDPKASSLPELRSLISQCARPEIHAASEPEHRSTRVTP